MSKALIKYKQYNRKEVHDIFEPTTDFTPQAGTWGLQGIIRLKHNPKDFVFFVTYGSTQGEHILRKA